MNLHLLGHIVGFPILHAGEGGRIALLDQLAGAGVARIIRLVQRLGVEVVHPVLGDRHLALIRRPRPESAVHSLQFLQGQGLVGQVVPEVGHAGEAIRCRNHKIAVHKVVRRVLLEALPLDIVTAVLTQSAPDGGLGCHVVRLHAGDGDGDILFGGSQFDRTIIAEGQLRFLASSFRPDAKICGLIRAHGIQLETQLHILVPAQLGLACRQGVAGLGRRQGDSELGAGLDGDLLSSGGPVVLRLCQTDFIGDSRGKRHKGLTLGCRYRFKGRLALLPHFITLCGGQQLHAAVALAGDGFVDHRNVGGLGGLSDGHGKVVACQLVSIAAGRYLVGVNADIYRPFQLIGFALPHFGFAPILHLIPLIGH